MAATERSPHHCLLIRIGKRAPDPHHWQALGNGALAAGSTPIERRGRAPMRAPTAARRTECDAADPWALTTLSG